MENLFLLTARIVDNSWKIYRKAYALQDGKEVKSRLSLFGLKHRFIRKRSESL